MGADRTIDLTDQVCPMTFVRTRLALDELDPGQTLMILLAGAEPQARVPRTVRELGHVVLEEATGGDGVLHLLVRRS
jgi:tRNA 2-thiouridine synthesizing protein A